MSSVQLTELIHVFDLRCCSFYFYAYSSDDDYIYANDNNMQMYIQPEALVTVFLVASSIGTAFEPWILGRLGLRRTIVFGAFCNMVSVGKVLSILLSFLNYRSI